MRWVKTGTDAHVLNLHGLGAVRLYLRDDGAWWCVFDAWRRDRKLNAQSTRAAKLTAVALVAHGLEQQAQRLKVVDCDS